MKKFQPYLLCFLIGLLSLVAFKSLRLDKAIKKLAKKTYKKVYNDHKIHDNLALAFPITENKPIVVVITSYKNEDFCERNLNSILEQTYDNYRVIFIDDCSPDSTFEKATKMVKQSDKEHLFTLIRNPTRKMKFTNIYNAFHSCKDHEIICILDGDDWYSDKDVLKKVNHYYQNPEVWLTFGSAVDHPNYKRRYGKNYSDSFFLKQKARDSNEFHLSVLRTFYAGLFKQIKLKDFLYKGKFLTSADDPAFMYPMLEMAPTHCLYVNDILYVINDINPISDHHYRRKLQESMHKYIQTKPKYKVLPSSFSPLNTKTLSSTFPLELIITSNDTPLFLATSLNSYLQSISSLSTTTVYFTASNDAFLDAYNKIAEDFPQVNFVQAEKTINNAIETHLKESDTHASPYIAIATDEFILSQNLNLTTCVEKMEGTGAKSFFLGHMINKISGNEVEQQYRALNNESIAKMAEFQIDSFFGILLKQDVLQTLEKLHSSKKGFLATHLFSVLHEEELSLFHENPKTSLLTSDKALKGCSKTTLLKKFQEGYHSTRSLAQKNLDNPPVRPQEAKL